MSRFMGGSLEFVSKASWISVATLFSAGCGYLISLLVARYYGANGLGQLSFAQSLMEQALVLTVFGTNTLAVLRSAGKDDSVSATQNILLQIRIPMAILAFTLGCVIVALIGRNDETFALTVLLLIVVFPHALSPLWYTQVARRTDVLAWASACRGLLDLIVVSLVVVSDAPIYWLASGRLIAEAVVMLAVARWAIARTHWHFSPALWSTVKVWFASGRSIALTQISRGWMVGLDPFLLALFVSMVQVGIYSAAYKIFLLMLALSTGYIIVLQPRMASAYNSGKDYLPVLRHALMLSLPFCLLAIVLVWVAGEWFIVMSFGAEFAESADILRVLTFAASFNVLNRQVRQALLVTGGERIDFRATLFVLVLASIAKFFGVVQSGIMAVAIATVFGEVLLFVLLSALVARSRAANTG